MATAGGPKTVGKIELISGGFFHLVDSLIHEPKKINRIIPE